MVLTKKIKSIEDRAIEVVKQWEKKRNRKAKRARTGSGYDLDSSGRKIEVKATEAKLPNKAGLHITLLPRQYEVLQENPDYWIYRVYNVNREGKEKVIPIPQNVIRKHLKPFKVRRFALTKEEWEQLENEETQ